MQPVQFPTVDSSILDGVEVPDHVHTRFQTLMREGEGSYLGGVLAMGYFARIIDNPYLLAQVSKWACALDSRQLLLLDFHAMGEVDYFLEELKSNPSYDRERIREAMESVDCIAKIMELAGVKNAAFASNRAKL